MKSFGLLEVESIWLVYTHMNCVNSFIDKIEFTDAHSTKIICKIESFRNTALIRQSFNRDGSLYLACKEKCSVFTNEQPTCKTFKLWSCHSL